MISAALAPISRPPWLDPMLASLPTPKRFPTPGKLPWPCPWPFSTFVVLPTSHALGAKDVVKMSALIGLSTSPALHDLRHFSMKLAPHIHVRRVVKDPEDVVEDPINGNIWVFPCTQDPRHDVPQYTTGCLPCRLVWDIREVILGQQRMRRISTVRVHPEFVLVICASVDGTGTADSEPYSYSVDDGSDKRGEQGEHEEGELYCDFIDDAFQTGGFGDGGGDELDNFVRNSRMG